MPAKLSAGIQYMHPVLPVLYLPASSSALWFSSSIASCRYGHKGSLAYVGRDKAVMDLPQFGPIFGYTAGEPALQLPALHVRLHCKVKELVLAPHVGVPLVCSIWYLPKSVRFDGWQGEDFGSFPDLFQVSCLLQVLCGRVLRRTARSASGISSWWVQTGSEQSSLDGISPKCDASDHTYHHVFSELDPTCIKPRFLIGLIPKSG